MPVNTGTSETLADYRTFTVGLARVKGQNVTSHQVLAQIEDFPANVNFRITA